MCYILGLRYWNSDDVRTLQSAELTASLHRDAMLHGALNRLKWICLHGGIRWPDVTAAARSDMQHEGCPWLRSFAVEEKFCMPLYALMSVKGRNVVSRSGRTAASSQQLASHRTVRHARWCYEPTFFVVVVCYTIFETNWYEYVSIVKTDELSLQQQLSWIRSLRLPTVALVHNAGNSIRTVFPIDTGHDRIWWFIWK